MLLFSSVTLTISEAVIRRGGGTCHYGGPGQIGIYDRQIDTETGFSPSISVSLLSVIFHQ